MRLSCDQEQVCGGAEEERVGTTAAAAEGQPPSPLSPPSAPVTLEEALAEAAKLRRELQATRRRHAAELWAVRAEAEARLTAERAAVRSRDLQVRALRESKTRLEAEVATLLQAGHPAAVKGPTLSAQEQLHADAAAAKALGIDTGVSGAPSSTSTISATAPYSAVCPFPPALAAVASASSDGDPWVASTAGSGGNGPWVGAAAAGADSGGVGHDACSEARERLSGSSSASATAAGGGGGGGSGGGGLLREGAAAAAAAGSVDEEEEHVSGEGYEPCNCVDAGHDLNTHSQEHGSFRLDGADEEDDFDIVGSSEFAGSDGDVDDKERGGSSVSSPAAAIGALQQCEQQQQVGGCGSGLPPQLSRSPSPQQEPPPPPAGALAERPGDGSGRPPAAPTATASSFFAYLLHGGGMQRSRSRETAGRQRQQPQASPAADPQSPAA
ncbi:hypothetical protein GPECTOR_43g899 [Gonium pectorale]|uniref:Uncharacterized protein n=1 Tax=Gonium pectorale TaxID=33097 RepID=A0A150G9M1_GONPE|nr:hypothetical protein GPECTOR_43g899 [Gonium pectorale]|eukprot:KXZ46463.1 hypothetical protein GPECTOR_43g899 [Gonium pectorale]